MTRKSKTTDDSDRGFETAPRLPGNGCHLGPMPDGERDRLDRLQPNEARSGGPGFEEGGSLAVVIPRLPLSPVSIAGAKPVGV
jgi:hypothetical protein